MQLRGFSSILLALVDHQIFAEKLSTTHAGKSTNVRFHNGIPVGHKGITLWMTGLSGSGKSTISVGLEQALVQLQSKDYFVYRLDGDNLRFGLNRDLGFSQTDRQENVRHVAETSKLFAEAGAITIADLISPYAKDREYAREVHINASLPFMEVFVDAPLATVEDRDPKGLYKKARAGEIKGFTGIDAPYEAPQNPEVHLLTDKNSVQQSVNQILRKLDEIGIHTHTQFRPMPEDTEAECENKDKPAEVHESKKAVVQSDNLDEANALKEQEKKLRARIDDIKCKKESVECYLTEFPNQQQVKIMNTWLEQNEKGSFVFTGLWDPSNTTVVSPQATVDYGSNWFSISDGPAIVTTPTYDKFLSAAVYDMKHNVPAVIANPTKPILLKRPGQTVPEGDFHVVELETDQGLVLIRMLVVDNLDAVVALRSQFQMKGGKGDMQCEVQQFSSETTKNAHAVIDTVITFFNPDVVFGRFSGDVSFLDLAAGVKLGQLGTPVDTVRYASILVDDNGAPLRGDATYTVTVPSGLCNPGGYFSVTLYRTDNKGLIPNDLKIYDRTTFSSEPNQDGTTTITLSPSGSGKNGIPTGKDFYGVLRAYVPAPAAIMKVKVQKQ